MPPVPEQTAQAPAKVALQEDMPMSKVTSINTGEPEGISDVQKAALQSILSMKKVKYEELIKEAFEFNGIVKNPLPTIDDLTYQEAVCAVKYGHDKFRR
jgi:hypothetical protein